MKFKIFNFKTFSWKKYVFETLSIFIAVVSAFALNNWNIERRDNIAERDILKQVYSGVKNDLELLKENKLTAKERIRTCKLIRNLIDNKPVSQDSIRRQFLSAFLDAKFTANKTGYKGLESKGLDIIKNEKIRKDISFYYNYYFDAFANMESSEQLKVFKNYFFKFNSKLSPYMEFDKEGNLARINQPISLTKLEKKELYSYLWMIESTRNIKVLVYTSLEHKITSLGENVAKELKKNGITVEPLKQKKAL